MINPDSIPGATVIQERDLPDALRDIVACGDKRIEAFTADDLPPEVLQFLGDRPGVTVLLVDERRSPVRRKPKVCDLIGGVEDFAEDLRRLRSTGDEGTAGAVLALQSALFDLVATPAGRARDVRLKSRCARMHLAAANLGDAARAMIEAALATDARAWSIGKTGH